MPRRAYRYGDQVKELENLLGQKRSAWRAILQDAHLQFDDEAVGCVFVNLKYLSEEWRLGIPPIHVWRRCENERRTHDFARIRAAATELLSYISCRRGDPEWYLLGPVFLLNEAKRAAAAVALRELLDEAKQVEAENPQFFDIKRKKGRGEAPRTELFLRLRKLYMYLGGPSNIGSGGPLYRFVSACVAAIGEDISVPSPEAFRLLMVKALEREEAVTACKNVV
jgi:hypothetical protein